MVYYCGGSRRKHLVRNSDTPLAGCLFIKHTVSITVVCRGTRHHGPFAPLTHTFFKKKLITSQQISTSTHYLPCLTPHKSQSLEN